MSQNKPKESLRGETCPFCRKGKLDLQQIDYVSEDPDHPKICIPSVWIDHCPECGENIYPAETSQHIENCIAALDDQLIPRELTLIREHLGVDQSEMSEILGLGDKTYHRWENGAQFPSRSMGYYIRVLSYHPETFEWLRDRSWRKSNRLFSHFQKTENTIPVSVMFPNLTQPLDFQATNRRLCNPARGLTKVSFSVR